MGSLTHQTVNYVKGAGAGVEKRILDKIKALEHYVHCCVNDGEVAEFTLTADLTGLGSWQVYPGTGHVAIPAPGPAKVNVITRVVIELDVSVDITGGGLASVGNFGIYQVAGANLLANGTACPAGIVNNEIVAPILMGGGIDDYIINTDIVVDHLVGSAPAAATAVGTAKIKIYYKTVSFA